MEENKKQTNEVAQEEKPMITIEAAEYEHLRTENVRLRSDINSAIQQIQQMNDVIIEKRIGFLFKVVENALRFNEDFVDYCTKEIQDSLWAKEENKEKDGE